MANIILVFKMIFNFNIIDELGHFNRRGFINEVQYQEIILSDKVGMWIKVISSFFSITNESIIFY